ncbi:hypothetical protein K7432_013159 [Basidiobolus ranarum]|uniref:Uncharacterized protein n=1 Tax=Basidiobolus ranarum TaxID=34480 RepID=A0ABR2WJN8_9FUNG
MQVKLILTLSIFLPGIFGLPGIVEELLRLRSQLFDPFNEFLQQRELLSAYTNPHIRQRFNRLLGNYIQAEKMLLMRHRIEAYKHRGQIDIERKITREAIDQFRSFLRNDRFIVQ